MLLFVFKLLTLFISPTFAACSSPTAADGSKEWFSPTNNYKYCNGTEWVELSTCQSTGTACTVVGQWEYDTTAKDYKFCDGSNWIHLGSGNNVSTCSTNGQMEYDSTSHSFRYCNGTNLLQYPPSTISNLIANWRLDETSGTTAVNSYGTSSYDGTMTGGLSGASSVSGKVKTALSFNGTSDYIEVADPVDGSLELSSDMSISIWIYPTVVNVSQKIVYKGHSASPWEGWELMINSSGEPMFQTADTSANYYSTGHTAITANQWYHIVAIRSGNNLSMYVNNTLATWWNTGPIAGTVQDGDAGLFIGTSNFLGNYFSGYIDDVRIYNKALSAAEVSNLYSLCP